MTSCRCSENQMKREFDFLLSCDYIDYMFAKLREAKEQLSELVKRAAGGEEIIITVRGQPMARLSSIQPSASSSRNHASFADELTRIADSVRTETLATSPQTAWDQLRADRF